MMQSGLHHLLKKIDDSKSVGNTPESGFSKTARTDCNINGIAELLLSQEDQLQSHLSVREISHELRKNRSFVHRIIKHDLRLACLKRQRAQELSEQNKPK